MDLFFLLDNWMGRKARVVKLAQLYYLSVILENLLLDFENSFCSLIGKIIPSLQADICFFFCFGYCIGFENIIKKEKKKQKIQHWLY